MKNKLEIFSKSYSNTLESGLQYGPLLNENQYTLLDYIDNSAERNIEPIKEFVQTLVNEYNIFLDLFYYPITEKESILVFNNYSNNTEILERLCNFCDLHTIILSIDNINEISQEMYDLSFVENENVYINEYILRFPQPIKINEGIMLFSQVGGRAQVIDLQSTNIQSQVYKNDWYNEYIQIMNSEEYKKRRQKETHGVLINRNASKDRGCVSKVGFAIIGKCKVL